MHLTTAALFFAAAFALTACRSTEGQYFLGAEDYELCRLVEDAGRTVSYRLDPRNGTELRRVTEFDREQPVLGLQLVELDKARAEQRGVKPYAGLLVRGVAPGSTSAEGGVLVHDVLLAIDGKETVYLPQVRSLEAGLRAHQMVTAKVLRGQEQLDLPLVVTLRRERVKEEEVVPLERPQPLPRAYAGIDLLGIPAADCARIFGAPRQAVIVAQVEVGSPAWLAGIRAGDVVDTVDGAPVPDVHQLTRWIGERGEAEQPLRLGVRRGSGPAHEGVVALADYQGDGGAWIPLVFYLDNGTWSDHWSVGPFGLVMSNRNSYIADATTRRVKTRNVFSAVLGLFHVETSPEETEVRLLWFIRFDT